MGIWLHRCHRSCGGADRGPLSPGGSYPVMNTVRGHEGGGCTGVIAHAEAPQGPRRGSLRLLPGDGH